MVLQSSGVTLGLFRNCTVFLQDGSEIILSLIILVGNLSLTMTTLENKTPHKSICTWREICSSQVNCHKFCLIIACSSVDAKIHLGVNDLVPLKGDITRIIF